MSHENVEMVRKAYEENMDRRVALFAEHADSDLEWVPDGRVGEGLVHQRSRGRGVASGVEVEMDFWVVWTFDEQGLATRLVGFTSDDEAKARAAAGLPGAT